MSEPQAQLNIRMFGEFTAYVGGDRLAPKQGRRWDWLLAYLVLNHGRTVSREEIAEALWPDKPPERGLNSLAKTLGVLERELASEAWRIERPRLAVRFNLAGARVDLVTFDSAVSRVGEAVTDAIEKAVAAYSPELLQGWFQDWVIGERAQRAQRYVEALEVLLVRAGAREDYRTVVQHATSMLELEPAQESTAHAKMLALWKLDEHDAALLTYEQLMDALGVFPSDAVRQLAATIRQDRRRRGKPVTVVEVETHSRLASKHGLIPHPPTNLIGREHEIGLARELISRTRLLTLAGIGGIGKTRLAIALARELHDSDGHRVRFFDLSTFEQIDQLIADMAYRLGQPDKELHADALVRHVARAPLILFLDNCEHILDGVTRFVRSALEASSEVRVVVTSRTILGLAGETVLDLSGMGLPPVIPETTLEVLERYDASRLFLVRATDANEKFTVSDADALQLANLCRRLEGIPLAIELAAAQVRVLSMSQILDRLYNGDYVLRSPDRTDPRHESLRAVMQSSYDLLGESGRTLFRRMGVFPGSVARASVEWICTFPEDSGSDLVGELLELRNSSLIGVETGSGSTPLYDMLQPVREYAEELLTATPEGFFVRRRYVVFMRWAATEWEKLIKTSASEEVLQEVEKHLPELLKALEHLYETFTEYAGPPLLTLGLDKLAHDLDDLTRRGLSYSILRDQNRLIALECAAILHELPNYGEPWSGAPGLRQAAADISERIREGWPDSEYYASPLGRILIWLEKAAFILGAEMRWLERFRVQQQQD